MTRSAVQAVSNRHLPRARNEKARGLTRAAIIDAARVVAAREGAHSLSLRGVAAEAGYAPAALYGYFRNKDELLIALAAEDLSSLSRAMRDAVSGGVAGPARFAAATGAALNMLRSTESIEAAASALAATPGSDAERLFNGRLIGVLKILSDATGAKPTSRADQCDVVLLAASLTGLAQLARSGRLEALGFAPEEILARLDQRLQKS
jgi:AcrR family transcriptional regulator